MQEISKSTPESITYSGIRKLEFTARSSEYFSIWLSNLAFTVMTLGLYGPWAKVRRERYMLGNTILDGSPFEYTADPKKIFRGRVRVVFFFLLYLLLKKLFPQLNLLLGIIALAIFPWVLVTALRFKARYTRYKGIHFLFSGTYWPAFKAIVLNKFWAFFTFGLLYPSAKFREKKFMVEQLAFGKTSFKFNTPKFGFYKAYFSTAIPIVACAVVLVFTIIKFVGTVPNSAAPIDPKHAPSYLTHGILLFYAILFCAFSYLRIALARLTWDGTTLGNFQIRYDISFLRYLWIAFSNLLLILLTMGLASPYTTLRMRAYKTGCITLHGHDSLDHFEQTDNRHSNPLGDQLASIYDLDLDFGL